MSVGADRLLCPGCGGPKSKRAKLCATCRRAANTAGANLLLGQLTGPFASQAAGAGFVAQTTTPEPRLTDGQRRAFYAKANRLDTARNQRIGTTKRLLLEQAGVESTNDLSQSQASDLLDQLESDLYEAEHHA